MMVWISIVGLILIQEAWAQRQEPYPHPTPPPRTTVYPTPPSTWDYPPAPSEHYPPPPPEQYPPPEYYPTPGAGYPPPPYGTPYPPSSPYAPNYQSQGMYGNRGLTPLMMLLHLNNSGRITSNEMLRLMMMGGMKSSTKNPMQSYLYDTLTACKEPVEECTPPNNYNNVNCGDEDGEVDDNGDAILPCCLCTNY